MKTREDEHTELVMLIERVLTHQIDEEGIQRLDELLEADANARSIYIDYADLHAWLQRRYACGVDEDAGSDSWTLAGEKTSSGDSRRQDLPSRVWSLGILALAACLLFALTARLESPTGDSSIDELQLADDQASLEGVAVLSRELDVVWATESQKLRIGEAAPAGLLQFDSGLVQLDFYSGAIAVLEGPARIELISPLSARLYSGKLRTKVPHSARGFQIATASGTLVDLGTEFAMNLEEGGGVGEVHVIDGEVRFHPHPVNQDDAHLLLEGDALRFDAKGVSTSELRYSPAHFVGLSQVESQTRERAAKRLAAWRSWRDRWWTDPDLVAWYAYSPQPEWSRTMRNFAADAEEDSHGVVVGCEWTDGRWQGHRSLKYSSASHRVSINLPGEHRAMTLAAWVMVDKFHPMNNIALMHPDSDQPRHVHWTLDRGRLGNGVMLHFSETTKPPGEPFSAGAAPYRTHYGSKQFALSNEETGLWTHMAVVYDSVEQQVSHYSDGQLLRTLPLEKVRPVEIGIADIGNWPYKDWASGTRFESRHLTGKIDEFVVVGRALTPEEVKEMYRMGLPN